MLAQQLDSITLDDLDRLIDEEVPERRWIEYKRELPSGTRDGKRKLLAQVVSFANAAGGDLIYGIDAKDGVPQETCGLADFNDDEVRLHIEQLMLGNIKPRIPGIQLHSVSLADQTRAVLIIRIPRSWCGPHMLTDRSPCLFTRGSAGKYDMDINEIRAAFEGAADISDRLRAWRDERLGRLLVGDAPLSLGGRGCGVLHVVPIESLTTPWRFTGPELRDGTPDLHPLNFPHSESRHNIDGTLKSWNSTDHTSYVQLYHSGRIEAVETNLVDTEDGHLRFRADKFELFAVTLVTDSLNALHQLGMQGPFVIMLALLGAKGAKLDSHLHIAIPKNFPLERDVVVLPDLTEEQHDVDAATLLRPLFDILWNAFGFDKSLLWRSG